MSTIDVNISIEDILDAFSYTQCLVAGSKLVEQRKGTLSRRFHEIYIMDPSAPHIVLGNGVLVSLQ